MVFRLGSQSRAGLASAKQSVASRLANLISYKVSIQSGKLLPFGTILKYYDQGDRLVLETLLEKLLRFQWGGGTGGLGASEGYGGGTA